MPSDQGQNEPRFEPRISAPATEVYDRADRQGPKPRRARWLAVVVALTALGAFGGVAWYATSKGQKDPGATVPVITADRDPVKERPAEPGGMDVPNRNLQVFNRITPGTEPQKVERLLPPAETPVARPAAEATANPPSGPAVPDAPSIAARGDAAKDARAPAAPTPEREVAAVPVAVPKPPVEAAAQAARGETPAASQDASVQQAPVQQAPVQQAMTGAWRIQLGAVREEARAKSAVARIAKANADLFKGMSPEILRVDLGSKGIYYRMRMGPLADKAAADALCRQLAGRKVGCLVVKP